MIRAISSFKTNYNNTNFTSKTSSVTKVVENVGAMAADEAKVRAGIKKHRDPFARYRRDPNVPLTPEEESAQAFDDLIDRIQPA